MDEKEWLRGTILKIGTDINKLEGAIEHPYLEYLQSNESNKKEFVEKLSQKIIKIADSKEEIMDNRKWIVELVNEHASLKPLFTSPEDTKIETSVHYHPCSVGFFGRSEIVVNIIESYYPELLDEVADFDAVFEQLRMRSLRLNYELSVANDIRFRLGDYNEKEKDWFLLFSNSTAALKETQIREKFGIEAPCRCTRISTEQNLIQLNILNGNKNPLDEVIFAKPYSDWERS